MPQRSERLTVLGVKEVVRNVSFAITYRMPLGLTFHICFVRIKRMIDAAKCFNKGFCVCIPIALKF